VELRKVCGEAPCLEDFRAVHQRMMQMWEDRVSGEADATQLPCRASYAQAGCTRHSGDQATRNCRYPSALSLAEVPDARSSWPWHLETSFPECHLQ
jgi:hypothetical protein